jgi:hypothetical protein
MPTEQEYRLMGKSAQEARVRAASDKAAIMAGLTDPNDRDAPLSEFNLYDSLGPGKFEGAGGRLERALYDAGMESGADKELGDVSTFGYSQLFLDLHLKGIRRPIYAILYEDSDGNLGFHEFDSEADALAAWARVEKEWEIFTKDTEDI